MVTKVVSFDLWQTLITSNKNGSGARTKILAATFGVEATPEVAKAASEASKEFDDLSAQTGQEFGCGDRIQLFARKIGKPTLPADALAELVEKCQETILGNIPTLIEEETIAVLASIKQKGLNTALVSNTGYSEAGVMRQVVERVGLAPMFDELVFSSDVGYAKPSPIIFARVRKRFGVCASEMLHVGDSLPADFCGARSYGARALHYAPKQPRLYGERIQRIAEVLDYVDDCKHAA